VPPITAMWTVPVRRGELVSVAGREIGENSTGIGRWEVRHFEG
jgi:hypothetical protein